GPGAVTLRVSSGSTGSDGLTICPFDPEKYVAVKGAAGPAVLLRVTVCAVRVDCTLRSALVNPSTEPGLLPRGVVALTTELSAAGASRLPGMFTISCGSPYKVDSSSVFSWMPRHCGVTHRYACLALTSACPTETGPLPMRSCLLNSR